jgi:hypothetical protein
MLPFPGTGALDVKSFVNHWKVSRDTRTVDGGGEEGGSLRIAIYRYVYVQAVASVSIPISNSANEAPNRTTVKAISVILTSVSLEATSRYNLIRKRSLHALI